MESRRRSIAKTISWRVVATFVTAGIVYVLTGEWKAAMSIGGLDTLVKLGVYYAHERAWARVRYGNGATEYEI